MLKQLMLAKKIEQRKAELAELAEQEQALKTREAELEATIDEAKDEEEVKAVEEEVEKLEGEKAELVEKKTKLEEEIAALEGELEELKSKAPKNNNTSLPQRAAMSMNKGGEYMKIRRGFFNGYTRAEVQDLIHRQDVKDFLAEVRARIGENRAVIGAELTIPDVLLDLLRDNLHRYSKLITKVRYKPLKGKARQNIVGAIPEGIWIEMIGALNELNFAFNQIEVDGYKVGGFIPIPNSIIEDSDENLTNEVMDAIAQGIGLALDKAILYGTGVKMPVGIVTRLAEVQQPAYWGVNEPAWTNLSATNLLTIDPDAVQPNDFFADLILKLGVARANYSDGSMFWAMSTQTYRYLQSKSVNFNAAGAVIAGMQNTVPIIGGEAVLLDFIPLYHIIGGYGTLYLLVERGGITLAQSEHAQFIQDNTVFKGIARYDGRPVFGEGFVGLTVDQGTNPVPPQPNDVAFPPDIANS